jgi:hypothetical protein
MDKLMKLVDAERADRDTGEPAVQPRPVEIEPRFVSRLPPKRDEEKEGLGVEATRRELEHGSSWRIDPLRIVDRDHQRTPGRELAEDVQKRERDRARIGRGAGYVSQP